MIWTLVLFLSFAQGLFLISIILHRKFTNILASYLIMAIVMVIVIINADYLVIVTGLYKELRNLHGFSYGSMFLMSPLFYFYTRSILDENFKWERKYLLHFIPYFLKIFHTLTFFVMPLDAKVQSIADFTNDIMKIDLDSVASLGLQSLHLAIYLFFTKKEINEKSATFFQEPYLISFEKRKKWLTLLFNCFVAYFISFTFWFVVVAIKGVYISNAEYLNVIVMSAIIYFLAYKSALDPELVTPDFIKKYNAQSNISHVNELEFLEKIKFLMEDERIYLNPNLDMNSLAKALELPAYQCSRLINDKFEKGFFDFVNEYRIEEVKRRLKDSNYHHFSILGIALQTGFNSKSSFNTAFKKVSGKTPSDFKKEA
jgi:AraC-like DNA-binding protein